MMDTVFESDFLGAKLDLLEFIVDLSQPLGRNFQKLFLFVPLNIFPKIRKVQNYLVEKGRNFLLLVLQIVAQVPEVSILVVCTLNQFRQCNCDISTSQLIVLFSDQFLNYCHFIFPQNNVIKLEVVDCLIYLVIELL